jgi:hypothetical protein
VRRFLVSESTLEAAPSPPSSSQASVSASAAGTRTLRSFARRHPWWSCGIGVVLFTIVLLRWAGTRPGFDPYGWLVWGHQTLSASLDTNAAPSWKPLPYLFTVVFALTGHEEVQLWMIASAAISLSGVIFAGRITYKLTGATPERRWAGYVAAAFAGLALLGIQNYFHYILSSQSDPVIVSLCLAAVDCHLDERPRAAFLLGGLAALGRPEVWPFLGLYSLWAWRKLRATRWLLITGWVLLALFWFGIPAVTSRTPFVSASNALDSGRRLTNNQVLGTIGRFLGLHQLSLELAALLGVVLAALRRDRRDRVTLVLAAAVAGWVVIEIGFALHGWPGLARYMFEASGVTIVLAGVCVGRLLAEPPRLPRIAGGSGLVAAALVAALVISLIPPAISAAGTEHKDIHTQRRRTQEIILLTTVIDRLGGAARLRACGEPVTRLEYQTTLAYTLGENVNRVGFKYSKSITHGNPIILFTPQPTGVGWKVQAVHQTNPACRSLP